MNEKAPFCAGHLLYVWEIRQHLLADFSCKGLLSAEKPSLYEVKVNFRF